MKTGSGIKNMIKYRLTGTPDGNLLVSFYHLNVFDQQAVNWRIAEQLVDEQMGPEVLYEGNLNNNTAPAARALPARYLQSSATGRSVCQLRAHRTHQLTG